MTQQRQVRPLIWNFLVYVPVGVVTLGYILFKRDFAKLHLSFDAVAVPVFIGEILLFYCLVMLLAKSIRYFRQPGQAYLWGLVFLLWFVLKTFKGYCLWGPLALRHAALYYYSFFFLVGYAFFDRRMFSKVVNVLLLMVVAGVFFVNQYDHYWTLTLGALGVILILKTESRPLKLIMLACLLLCFRYGWVLNTSRMMILSNILTIAYLMAGSIYLLKIDRRWKIAMVALIVLGIAAGVYKSLIKGESGRVFVTPGQVMKEFGRVDSQIQLAKRNYTRRPLKVGLFHPEEATDTTNDKYHYENKNYYYDPSREMDSVPYIKNMQAATAAAAAARADASGTVDQGDITWESINNIIFRLLIWRDMFHEMWCVKPLLGFDFGKPLRSISLEMLHWAEREWSRDGWIEPHNSFFHILYRAGIIGLVFVGLIWYAVVCMIRKAFREKSWVLVLLSAILLNWLIAANFLLILELPYTAIPFWFIAGMAWAYGYRKDRFVVLEKS